ncbi:hypothetical protein Tco_0144995 [Tanacetum coccineum]
MRIGGTNRITNNVLLASIELVVPIWDNEDVYDLGSVETEFPSIVFKDTLTSEAALYVLTPWQVLLTTMKLTLEYHLTNPTMKIARITIIVYIDEFNLKDETSLSEYDEEEQNVLNFNDLFPFKIIYPNDSKSDKDNDDDKVDIEHSSGDLSIKPLPDVINTDVGAYAHGSEVPFTSYPSRKIQRIRAALTKRPQTIIGSIRPCVDIVWKLLVHQYFSYVFPTRKKSRWGTIFPTGLKRYKEPLVEPKEIG